MQVRKNLHAPKAASKKPKKDSARHPKKPPHPAKKKHSKSKSRSPSSKQNPKHHRSISKARPAISPLPLHKSKLLNNSPNTLTAKKPKFKQKHNNSARILPSHRDNDKSAHLVSTKIITERSPLKTQREPSPRPLPDAMKKKKAGKKAPAKAPAEETKKPKKIIPSIKTQFSIRKESYFDLKDLEMLNLNEKRTHRSRTQEQGETWRAMSVNTESLREFGTSTKELDFHRLSDEKDLEFLRKEQELKWRIISLELGELKADRTPQKLATIIDETERNLSEFQTVSKNIMESGFRSHYVFESPAKVKWALRRKKKSVEETKELVKNLSDQRLLQELEMVNNINEEASLHVVEPEKQSSSFCLEFEKELEEYTQNHEPFQDLQIPHIPQLEYEKAKTVCEMMEISLVFELCQEIVEKERLLHGYLVGVKNNEAPPVVDADNAYSIRLAQGLFEYIADQQMVVEFLARLNVPFGNSPEVNLKWVRNFFHDDSEEVALAESTPEPVLDSEFLCQYDSNHYSVPSEGQYFYNHCIYGCIGELLDYHRPYGMAGLPPLGRPPNRVFTNFDEIAGKVIFSFSELVGVRMGRMEFSLEEDPVRVTERTYEMMDKYLVEEEEAKWKQSEDNIFEHKYLLASAIFDTILNEEVLLLFNEFL